MRKNLIRPLQNLTQAAFRNFTSETSSEIPSIPITIGRYEPLHKGHEYVFETLRKGSSILVDNPKFKDSHLPPAIALIGSSGEERDMVKNPFSFEQRSKMIGLVAPWMPGSDDPRNSPAFYPYVGTYDERRPPVLDNMAQKIKDHCVKHEIPLEYLVPTICVKADDKREFQVYGQRHYGHQMDVVGKGLGLRFHAEDVPDNAETIHATNIRKNLPQNFHLLDPKILQWRCCKSSNNTLIDFL